MTIRAPLLCKGELAFIKSPRSPKGVAILPHPSPSPGGKNLFKYSEEVLSNGAMFEETTDFTERDRPIVSPHPSFSSLDPLTSSEEESEANKDGDDGINTKPYSSPRWSKTYGKERCRWYLQSGNAIIEAPPKVPPQVKLDKYTVFVHEVQTRSGLQRQIWVNQGSHEVQWVAANQGYERRIGDDKYQLKFSGRQIRWVLKETYARRKSVDPVF